MTTEEFVDLIEHGHESPGVEFKPVRPEHRRFFLLGSPVRSWPFQIDATEAGS
jgi:hypothetical protein